MTPHEMACLIFVELVKHLPEGAARMVFHIDRPIIEFAWTFVHKGRRYNTHESVDLEELKHFRSLDTEASRIARLWIEQRANVILRSDIG